MGLFDCVGNAGKKLFGGGRIDEKAVADPLLSLGLNVRALSPTRTRKWCRWSARSIRWKTRKN